MDLYTDTQWFLKPSFDLEMKQYQCLAINQKALGDIEMTRLWHWHDYLYETVDLMTSFRENAKSQQESWKKALSYVDLKNCELYYGNDDRGNSIEEVHDIIDFAYPKMFDLRNRLLEKKSSIMAQIQVSHLGFFAQDIHHGFLAVEHDSAVRLYDYFLPSITYKNQQLEMTYLDTVEQNLSTRKLIKHVYQLSPGPYKQFWQVTGTNDLPVKESLEPIVSAYMVNVIREA